MYKVKSRYKTFYDGEDAAEALEIFEMMKRGGMTNIKMTPDMSLRGFVGDFVALKNRLIFRNEMAAFFVNKYLERYETPIELIGKEILILNDKFVSKIIYLTEDLMRKPAEIMRIAKNNLGITNDVKTYEARLENGETKPIFAFSISEAREMARKVTDSKVLSVKEVKND